MKKELEQLKKKLENFLSDPSNTLDEKWEMLISVPDLGKTSYRTKFGLDRDDSFLYEEPLYMEKYQESEVADLLQCLKEDEDFNLTEEEEQIFKKYCIDGGYSKMKFDW